MLAGTMVLFALSIRPVSNFLAYSLERIYPPPSQEILNKLDLVVVLDGGVYQAGGLRQKAEMSWPNYGRIFGGVDAFKRSGAKIFVLSGGAERGCEEKDAVVMANLAAALGVPKETIVTEEKAMNTMQHAAELAKLFPPERGLMIGVATSALHMPRSILVFRVKFGKDKIVPIPVDYLSSPIKYDSVRDFIPTAENFTVSSYALHEWIGIVWYLAKMKFAFR
jgi:uncharacterized SAM-binding protein YcdF (DUF218 family)